MKINRSSGINNHRPRVPRTPNFDCGVLPEPSLAFGGRHEHVDPKTGLALYGPYTQPWQLHPTFKSVTVGVVGPAAMISDAQQWLQACQGMLTNSGEQPFLYPHFPGFNAGLPFGCELVSGDTWNEPFAPRELEKALEPPDYFERIKRVVALYIRNIEILAGREPQPTAILCCIPQEVIDVCTVRKTKGGEIKRIKLTKAERRGPRLRRNPQQLSLLDIMGDDPDSAGESDEGWSHQNLRRGIKAQAMQFGIPTQLVWPRTIELHSEPKTTDRVQDIATRAWNFTTALYHKAGGSPWRLAHLDPGVCFVGISFYRELGEENPAMRTSMAQAFTAAGDGYVLRGNSFEWNEARDGRSPHLDQKGAASLMQDILDLYRKQNRGSLPNRVVVHKTSRYWDDELAGFEDACSSVPRHDFVALGWRGIQFYRTGDYPPLRGSWVKFSDTDLLLYTTGYCPYLRTYPGPRVPRPLEIVEHHGDSLWRVILEEMMGLTKMNWNTADLSCSDPISVAFSQRVGQILAELPPDLPIRPEYRFYM